MMIIDFDISKVAFHQMKLKILFQVVNQFFTSSFVVGHLIKLVEYLPDNVMFAPDIFWIFTFSSIIFLSNFLLICLTDYIDSKPPGKRLTRTFYYLRK